MMNELTVMLLSALPVSEMRVALPLALTTFHLPPLVALFWCLLGNILVIPVLLFSLPAGVRWLERHGPAPLKRLIARYFAYLRSKHTDTFEKVGAASLSAVAILPLPGAGIWTGCLLAVLFDIRPRLSLPALVGGAVVEAVIIFLIVQGTLGALRWLL